MVQRSASDITGEASSEGIALDCYVYSAWKPRIRAASPRREWMDATPERFAYRCLPLNIANAHGWEILSPCGFEAEWNGGSGAADVVVRPDPGSEAHRVPVALFGQGTVTFHVEGILRTPPGFNLWVGGPPNHAKDGIAPLGGVIETDWSPYSFTMNWRFTRTNHAVRFEENEPFCFFFPVERHLLESVRPRILGIETEPELKRQFEEWSRARDAFQVEMASNPPDNPSAKWQKFYYRGVLTDGCPGTQDHQSKLRLAEFDGAAAFHRETPDRPPACPATELAQSPPETSDHDRLGAKYQWILSAKERLRALAPRAIERKRGLSSDEFLVQHYAANHPVILDGELADWPALGKWTPDYLKQLIGPREIEVQANRNPDPNFERNMVDHCQRMPFDQFIDGVTRPENGNDLYLTAYNSAANTVALEPLQQDLGFLDKVLSRESESPHGMPWIGSANSFTPLHHDLTNNLLIQITGRKRVLLVAPDATPRLYNDYHVYSRVRDLAEPGVVERFPALEGVHVHQVVLGPGDALFIPLGWWHQVTALDFSVMFTHTNFRWPNDFHADHPS
ncbi:MAG: cupin-like domain-containing protein [Porphyrobacter sp.]|nr:cupin-like domain-containing protein [Porphyrobacter sp.]